MYIWQDHQFGSLTYVMAAHEDCMDPNGKYPTVLYLHGAGSRGTDLSVLHNASALVNGEKMGIRMRFYAPQCHTDTWFELFEQLIAFAKFVCSRPTTDQARFTCTGVSMGGYAAWQLGMSCPELFAGLAPVCGGGMCWNAARLKDVPIRAFHGALDSTVNVSESVNMVNSVNRAGGNAWLTVYPEAQHNAWDPTYQNPEFWEWLASCGKTR